MTKTIRTPDARTAQREHERRNEGGREFGHVHQPTQAQQASLNQGLTDPQRVSPPGDKLKRAREGEMRAA